MPRLLALTALSSLLLCGGCGSPSGAAPVQTNAAVSSSSPSVQPAEKPPDLKFEAEYKAVLEREASGEYSKALEAARSLKERYAFEADARARADALVQRLETSARKEAGLATALRDLADENLRENARVKLSNGGTLARSILRRAVVHAEPPIAQPAAELLASLRDEDTARTLLLRIQQKPPAALRTALLEVLRANADLVQGDVLPQFYTAFKTDPDANRDIGAVAASAVRRSSEGTRQNFNKLLGDEGAYELLKRTNLISEVPKEGLVLWLRFDEMTGTAAGNSAGLQVPGGALNGARFVHGRYDGAIACNGTDELVQVDATKLELGKDNQDFSVAFWIHYQPAAGGWRNLTHKGNADAERTFAIWMHPEADRLHYRISTEASGNEGGDSACTLTPGNWYHIAYVKEDKTLTLYVNGAIDSSVQLAGRTVGNTGPIYIGKDPWYQSVEGRYDDYVIYTRALSAEEVKGMAGNVEKPSHMPLSAPEAAPQF